MQVCCEPLSVWRRTMLELDPRATILAWRSKVWRYELSRRASRRTAAVQIETPRVGAWRSLVAHTLGVRVVAGSNPAAPTNL
jgi:hypothetical protein